MSPFFTIMIAIVLTGCGNSLRNKLIPIKQFEQTILYHCDSNQKINVIYPTNNKAILDYQNDQIQMEIAVSASGAKYIGDGFEWWTKGTEQGASALLFQYLNNVTSPQLVEKCSQISK